MASKAHKFLVNCIVRKIREKGYEVVALDGDYVAVSTIKYKVPPTIKRHRPDIIGIDVSDFNICIGEAKTTKDLLSKRTAEQFKDYAATKVGQCQDKECELIIAVPKSAEVLLKQTLANAGLKDNKNISCLLIPEELFPKNEGI